jgi:hypothetical protein
LQSIGLYIDRKIDAAAAFKTLHYWLEINSAVSFKTLIYAIVIGEVFYCAQFLSAGDWMQPAVLLRCVAVE